MWAITSNAARAKESVPTSWPLHSCCLPKSSPQSAASTITQTGNEPLCRSVGRGRNLQLLQSSSQTLTGRRIWRLSMCSVWPSPPCRYVGVQSPPCQARASRRSGRIASTRAIKVGREAAQLIFEHTKTADVVHFPLFVQCRNRLSADHQSVVRIQRSGGAGRHLI